MDILTIKKAPDTGSFGVILCSCYPKIACHSASATREKNSPTREETSLPNSANIG